MSSTDQQMNETLSAKSLETSDKEATPPEESPSFRDTFREKAHELIEYRELLLQMTLRDI